MIDKKSLFFVDSPAFSYAPHVAIPELHFPAGKHRGETYQ